MHPSHLPVRKQARCVELIRIPSGLIGLTGVSTFTRGNQTVIDIGNNILQINNGGGLLVDPEEYTIISRGTSNRVFFANGSNSRLYIGRTYLLPDGHIRNTRGTALIAGDSPAWFRPGTNPGDYGSVTQKGGSIIVWRGAAVVCPDSGYSIDDGNKTRIQDGVCISGQGGAPSNRGVISSFHNSDLIVDGFRHVGGELILGTDSGSSEISGLVREDSAFATFPNRITSITLRNLDVGGKGNVLDVPIQSEGVSLTRTTCLDSATGNNMIMIGAEDVSSDSRNKGYNTIVKGIEVGFFDALNNPLEGGKFFIRDTDNGQRKNLNSEDDTADKTYAGTFAANGFAPAVEVITGIVNVAGSNPRGVSNQAQYRMDFRGKFDSTLSAPNIPDNTAEFDLNVYQYGFTPSALPRTLIGNSTLTLRETGQPNLNTTETDTAIVAAYASLDTAPAIKDRADLFLLDNFGTYLSFIVGRSGAQVNLSDGLASIMTIDDGAGQVFNYDGAGTITVLSSTCESGATGGTVNVEGGVTMQNARFDSDVNYNSTVNTLNNITCTGTMDFSIAGTYNLVDCNINEVTNSSGGSVTLNLTGTSVATNTGPNITLQSSTLFELTGLVAGSEVRVYEAGTTSELDGIESSGTTFSTTLGVSSVDLVVFNTNYLPIRLLGISTSLDVSLPIQQTFDRNFNNP